MSYLLQIVDFPLLSAEHFLFLQFFSPYALNSLLLLPMSKVNWSKSEKCINVFRFGILYPLDNLNLLSPVQKGKGLAKGLDYSE